LVAGCGGSAHGGSGGSGGAPLTLSQVEANLQKAGYKITVFTPNEGALNIDGTHKANAGFSIDYSPGGQQLYVTVFETSDPAVRAAVISQNSAGTAPVVRGDLIFTISGTAPELQTILKDAGDAGSSNPQTGSASPTDIAAATAATQNFIAVYAAGDTKALCASFTPQVLVQSKTFCDPASIFYKRKPDPRVRGYAITAVTVNGDTATATVNFQGLTELLALRKVAGQWKIDTQLGAGHLF
jgi:hypothetical protein